MSLLQRSRREGKTYLNPIPTAVGGFSTMAKVLPLYLRNRAETEPRESLGPFRTDPAVFQAPPSSGLRVTWFGHSSNLLELDGFRVLLDPVWEPRASPLTWLGPKRFFAPTLALAEMPRLDAVLISHDHYDHLGATTIRSLSQSEATRGATWITSAGVARRLSQFGVPAERIRELDWTQTVEVPSAELAAPLRITAWPSRHFSGRTMWDRFSTLWSSFVLEGPRHRVYFGADSGPWPGFEEIASRYDRIHLTMLEIGAYHPLWGEIHLGPDGAAEAYRQMGGPERAGTLMPIHWGLFNLALHGWRDPAERITFIAAAEGWSLLMPTPGQPTEVGAEVPPCVSDWWHREAGSGRT